VLSDGLALVCNIPSSTPSVIPLPLPPDVLPHADCAGAVESVSFSPADATLAVGYDDGSVAIFRVLYSNNAPTSPPNLTVTMRRTMTQESVVEIDGTPSLRPGASGSSLPTMKVANGDAAHNTGPAIVHPSAISYEDIGLSLYRR